MHENRDISRTPWSAAQGRSAKAINRTADTNVREKSDCAVVPVNQPNNEGQPSAEAGEGRAQIEENTVQSHMRPTQSGQRMSQGLHGVRQAAKERKQERFTALLHHLSVGLLRDSFYALQRKASPGIDGVTWQEYETGLEDRLVDLHRRVHRGAYRAKPSRRVYIPKADRRILRLIQKWLKAGVSEDGQWSETKTGTPQGAVVSPLLANVYLHYVFDQWVEVWRKKVASGEVIVVRYADDLVVGFQYRTDAERFLQEFRERLAKFGLELHADKTRLIEFGRFAARDRKYRGEGKPETFTFLGFTHFCGQLNSRRAFIVWRITPKKRMVAKLKAIKAELQRRKHHRTTEVGAWLRTVVLGYYQYHAVPGNSIQLRIFNRRVGRLWRSVLVRRSQRAQMRWDRLIPLLNRWIPQPRILHPYPDARFAATHPR